MRRDSLQRCTDTLCLNIDKSTIWYNNPYLQSFISFKEDHMARVAMYLQDKHEIREGMQYAQYAEQRGFEAIWQAESRLVRDAIVPMAAFAAVTSRIKVGSGVLNNWTRNIGLLASTFLTLDDLATERINCRIGSWR